MKTSARVGLLPLYLELYDRVVPERRPDMEAFADRIAKALEEEGVAVNRRPICRVKAEFEKEIEYLEGERVDALVTLHLAYSPSLESSQALAKTALPIIVLDTTPDAAFGLNVDPARIMFNHGIHGVQDMCNLLLRNRKAFRIEAGHWEKSDVLARVAGWARAAAVAARLKTAKVGVIGEPFAGMGDFGIPFDVMTRTIGFKVVQTDAKKLAAYLPDAKDPAVREEMDNDLKLFQPGAFAAAEHQSSTLAALAVRRWAEAENLTAFTFNFLNFPAASGFPTVPFLEASKAMGRGLGYAGEGDALTAALVGALLFAFPETTFTEMFCPDWEGERIFLSHMGEVNPRIARGRANLVRNAFPIACATQPLKIAAAYKPGQATLVNLAPGPNDTYTLIAAPVTVQDAEGATMPDSVRAWISPEIPIANFLAEYSAYGGTHHDALVYGDKVDFMGKLANAMGWNFAAL